MTQTLAVFYEAYRSLNAKKMFWVVLVLSGFVAGSFAFVGINEGGLKILIWQIDSPFLNSHVMKPATFYKQMFVSLGIGYWLSWLAAILALISTAGIFPDLLNSGSINLLVSKPIGRLRLFATQYIAGLLFVILQVLLFTTVCFLVIGLRGGAWVPGLFLAVPLVVCFFSYLFSVCVLLGLMTRSTLASLLLTMLFWFFIFLLGSADAGLLNAEIMARHGSFPPVGSMDAPGQRLNNTPNSSGEGSAANVDAENSSTQQSAKDSSANKTADQLATAHRIVVYILTVFPKTAETIALLERNLLEVAELSAGGPPGRRDEFVQIAREAEETRRARSVWWIVGTSLGFEVLILAWAAVIFCRRDF
jgi:ABC-type transport system involved in multi-copper enzyme maturation permease subunit